MASLYKVQSINLLKLQQYGAQDDYSYADNRKMYERTALVLPARPQRVYGFSLGSLESLKIIPTLGLA